MNGIGLPALVCQIRSGQFWSPNTVGVGIGLEFGVGSGFGDGSAFGVGLGVGLGVELGDGDGDGDGDGEGFGVGLGVTVDGGVGVAVGVPLGVKFHTNRVTVEPTTTKLPGAGATLETVLGGPACGPLDTTLNFRWAPRIDCFALSSVVPTSTVAGGTFVSFGSIRTTMVSPCFPLSRGLGL
jgi:hypothetical protein